MDPADGRVISNFIMQALQNKPITIYGDGQQTRSFCYASELIDAIIATMNTGDDFTGPVNIGNPAEFTMLKLANKVIELTGSSSELIYKTLPSDDPKQRQPNIELAQQRLGWTPQIQLDAGLKNTIEYFRNITNQGL
jgi:UDP-glucuronate decarboxylase